MLISSRSSLSPSLRALRLYTQSCRLGNRDRWGGAAELARQATAEAEALCERSHGPGASYGTRLRRHARALDVDTLACRLLLPERSLPSTARGRGRQLRPDPSFDG